MASSIHSDDTSAKTFRVGRNRGSSQSLVVTGMKSIDFISPDEIRALEAFFVQELSELLSEWNKGAAVPKVAKCDGIHSADGCDQ